MLRRAVAIGLALPDVALRSGFIRALRDRLDLTDPTSRLYLSGGPDRRERADANAFAAARRVIYSVADRQAVDAVVAPTRLVWFAPEFGHWLERLFVAWGQPLPVIDHDNALSTVESITDVGVRARALALLGPLLRPGREAARLASEINDDADRASALAILAIHFQGSSHREALAAAQSISDATSRVTAVAALAPHLAYAMGPLKSLLAKTLDEVREIEPSASRARAIAALAPVLRGHFPDLASLARQEVQDLSPSARRVASEALELPWPQPYIPVSGDAPELTPEEWLPVIAGLANTDHRSRAQRVRVLNHLLDDVVIAMRDVAFQAPRMDRGGGEKNEEPVIRGTELTSSLAQLPSPERIVSLGFAPGDDPAKPLAATDTLGAYYEYAFWVEIGIPQEGSIVTNPTPILPDQQLEAGAIIAVVIFTPPDGIRIREYFAIGEFLVQADRTVRVLRQPGDHVPREYRELQARRLFFPVTAPGRQGASQLRCNFYYQQNLVQSHLVTAMVTAVPQAGILGGLASTVDYNLSKTLEPATLKSLVPQRLSLMLNHSDDGSHSFMFYGKSEGATEVSELFRHESALTSDELQNLIDIGRGALRKAAWGDGNPWQSGTSQHYRYQGPENSTRLTGDLVSLSRAGYQMYVAIAKEVAGGKQPAKDLAALMRTYGLVQIALKERPEHVFPAALMYDAPLDTNADLALCREFLTAMGSGEPLETAPCFTQGCREYGNLKVVCPSGFWGYRHALGLPLSTRHAPDVPSVLEVGDGVEFVMLISTDPQFVKRAQHLADIRGLCSPQRWEVVDTRDDTFSCLKRARPHLVYFYCHGGVTSTKIPFLEIGPPGSGGGILSDNFVAHEIEWTRPRPLVFINGCHTTALEPEAAISFVSTLIEDCAAAGVIGSEITIFEPLACRFAEECLQRFFREKLPIGEAVRRARLALLREANPLGLVYIPFVQTGLRLGPV
jgi:hypothetical protein